MVRWRSQICNTSQEECIQYSELRRAARMVVRAKQKQEWDRLIQSIGEDSSQNPKRMWSNIKRIIGTGKARARRTVVLQYSACLFYVSRTESYPSWNWSLAFNMLLNWVVQWFWDIPLTLLSGRFGIEAMSWSGVCWFAQEDPDIKQLQHIPPSLQTEEA